MAKAEVLIVDDEESILKSLSGVLEDEEYEVLLLVELLRVLLVAAVAVEFPEINERVEMSFLFIIPIAF